jgi:hypothetical protein
MIEVGMSRADAERLLGGPPGFNNARPVSVGAFRLVSTPGLSTQCWIGNRGAIALFFDADGKVRDRSFLPIHVFQENIAGCLLSWFGL